MANIKPNRSYTTIRLDLRDLDPRQDGDCLLLDIPCTDIPAVVDDWIYKQYGRLAPVAIKSLIDLSAANVLRERIR